MASGVDELLEMLYEMLQEARSVPLSSEKCVIDREQMLDLLDEIKAKLPVELNEAKKLLSARAEYIASAKREAESIKKHAEEQARSMVSEERILASAHQKSGEIIKKAEERALELRKAANEYCDDLLRRTEEALSAAYDEMKRSRVKFRATIQNLK